jgi:hypothetical protein
MIVDVGVANPLTDLPACLGKVRWRSEEAARSGHGRPYRCLWCDGWHTAVHELKGRKKSNGKARDGRNFHRRR